MLCYLSSRDANDVIRDSFRWIADNAKAARTVFAVVLSVCVVMFAAYGAGHIDRHSLRSDYTLLYVFSQMYMGKLGFGEFMPSTLALIMGLLSFVTTLLVSPVLSRYFMDHRSVRNLGIRSLWEELGTHIGRAVLCAAITAAVFVVVPVAHPGLSILIMMVFMWLQPCLLTGRFYAPPLSSKFLMILKSVFFILVIVSVIKGFPFLCIWFASLFVFVTGDTLGVSSLDGMTTIYYLNIVLTGFTYLTYCIAVAVYVVCNFILYGTLYSTTREKAQYSY